MPLILGIDPGSIKTGFGVINATGSRASYVASGLIRLPSVSLPEKLKIIYTGISDIIRQHGPVEMAVEEVFFARDPRAALKLGQARGAAIVAGVQAGLEVSEYSAKTVSGRYRRGDQRPGGPYGSTAIEARQRAKRRCRRCPGRCAVPRPVPANGA